MYFVLKVHLTYAVMQVPRPCVKGAKGQIAAKGHDEANNHGVLINF